MSVYTYLIKSAIDDSYYVGISENPAKRLMEHNSGMVNATARKGPYELVYSKLHTDYQEARKHEKWLKKKNKEYKHKLEGAG